MKFWIGFFWVMNVCWLAIGIVAIAADAPAETQNHAVLMWMMTLTGAVLLGAISERQS